MLILTRVRWRARTTSAASLAQPNCIFFSDDCRFVCRDNPTQPHNHDAATPLLFEILGNIGSLNTNESLVTPSFPPCAFWVYSRSAFRNGICF